MKNKPLLYVVCFLFIKHLEATDVASCCNINKMKFNIFIKAFKSVKQRFGWLVSVNLSCSMGC